MGYKDNAFVVAFAVGAVLIAIMKFITGGSPVIGGVVASALAIAVMLFYMVSEKRTRPPSTFPRLGDEVYYLGLLYTLTSLCVALVALFLIDNAQLTHERRTDEMVGSFGIALLTTIAGIVMRIRLLDQRSTDLDLDATIIRIPRIVETEQDEPWPNDGDGKFTGSNRHGATIDLETYAFELRRQLQLSTDAFASFTNQAIVQAKTLHSHSEEMMRTFHDGLEKAARSELQSIQASFQAITSSTQKVIDHAETQQLNVQEVFEILESRLHGLGGIVERLQEGSDTATHGLEAVAEQSRESGEVLSSGARALNRQLGELASAVNVQIKGQTEINEQAEQSLQQINNVNLVLPQFGEMTRNVSDELNKLPDSLEAVNAFANNIGNLGNAGKEFAALAEQANSVTERLAQLSDAGTKQEAELSVAVTKLRALGDAVGAEIDIHQNLHKALQKLSRLVDNFDRYGQHLGDSEREIQRVNAGLKRFSESLEESGPQLAETISAAIVAIDEVKSKDKSRKNRLGRLFR